MKPKTPLSTCRISDRISKVNEVTVSVDRECEISSVDMIQAELVLITTVLMWVGQTTQVWVGGPLKPDVLPMRPRSLLLPAPPARTLLCLHGCPFLALLVAPLWLLGISTTSVRRGDSAWEAVCHSEKRRRWRQVLQWAFPSSAHKKGWAHACVGWRHFARTQGESERRREPNIHHGWFYPELFKLLAKPTRLIKEIIKAANCSVGIFWICLSLILSKLWFTGSEWQNKERSGHICFWEALRSQWRQR